MEAHRTRLVPSCLEVYEICEVVAVLSDSAYSFDREESMLLLPGSLSSASMSPPQSF